MTFSMQPDPMRSTALLTAAGSPGRKSTTPARTTERGSARTTPSASRVPPSVPTRIRRAAPVDAAHRSSGADPQPAGEVFGQPVVATHDKGLAAADPPSLVEPGEVEGVGVVGVLVLDLPAKREPLDVVSREVASGQSVGEWCPRGEVRTPCFAG